MTTNLSDPKIFKERFIKWLKKQPAKKEFYYFDCNGCLFAAFARDNGFPFSHAGGEEITLIKDNLEELTIDIPLELATAVSERANTFTPHQVLTALRL